MYFGVVLCIVCFVSFSVLFVCICVLYDCHRVATQSQLNISYCTTYHITSYHIISYHIISYHIISYHIISYHIIYHIISYRIVSYRIVSYRIVSYHISYHIISYHIISYHIISYHIASHRIASHRTAPRRVASCRVVSYIISYTKHIEYYDLCVKRWKGIRSGVVPLCYVIRRARIEHYALVLPSAVTRFTGRRIASGLLSAVFLFLVGAP